MVKIINRYVLPVLLLALLFYVTSHSREIMNNYRYLFTGKETNLTEKDIALRSLVAAQDRFYEGKDKDKLFDLDSVKSTLSALPGCTLMSDRPMSLVGGVWTSTEGKGSAQEFILRCDNISVGLFNLDTAKLYYESVNANYSDKTVTVLVRLEGVK